MLISLSHHQPMLHIISQQTKFRNNSVENFQNILFYFPIIQKNATTEFPENSVVAFGADVR